MKEFRGIDEDYNNNIGDAAMKTVEGAGFRPMWNDLEIDVSKEFTYNAQNPKMNLGVIDHILYNTSAGAKVTDGGIIELKNPLSDHKPIWEQIVQAELKRLKKKESAIVQDPKGTALKVGLAKRLRKETTTKNPWIAERQKMGHPNYVSNLVNKA